MPPPIPEPDLSPQVHRSHTVQVAGHRNPGIGKAAITPNKDVVLIRLLTVVASGVMIAGLGVAIAQTPALPEGPGYDALVRACSDCHAAELVLNYRLNAAGWDDMVSMMTDRGATVSDADRKILVDYLTENLGLPTAQ